MTKKKLTVKICPWPDIEYQYIDDIEVPNVTVGFACTPSDDLYRTISAKSLEEAKKLCAKRFPAHEIKVLSMLVSDQQHAGRIYRKLNKHIELLKSAKADIEKMTEEHGSTRHLLPRWASRR
jgi:hypothetical protein